jgi:hypothetical protein
VSSSEYHRLYKLQQLETSASTCQLCRLLLRSAGLGTQSVTPELEPGSPNIPRVQISDVLGLVVKETLRKGQDPQLTLQLLGGNIHESKTLFVKQGESHYISSNPT